VDTTFSVLESVPVGTTVGSVASAAADQDAGATLTFTLERDYTFAAASTYEQCLSTCQGLGLQTVCLEGAAAQQELVAAYEEHNSTTPHDFLWIGLRESEDDNTPWFGTYLWEVKPVTCLFSFLAVELYCEHDQQCFTGDDTFFKSFLSLFQPPGCVSSLDNWEPGLPSTSTSKACASLNLQQEEWIDNLCSSRSVKREINWHAHQP
jgi:hypothetical protein